MKAIATDLIVLGLLGAGTRWTVPAGWESEVERVEDGRVFVVVNGRMTILHTC